MDTPMTVEEKTALDASFGLLTAEKMGLSRQDVVDIFRAHEKFTRAEIIYKFTQFNRWEARKQKENACYRIYEHVHKHPEIFRDLISQEEIHDIMDRTRGRTTMGLTGEQYRGVTSVRGGVNAPVKDLNKKVEGIVAKLSNILDMKLDTINSKKELQKIPLVQLTTALGTMIDKNRLMRGEATEHVAHIITEKGVDKMSKDDILEALSTQRSKDIESK